MKNVFSCLKLVGAMMLSVLLLSGLFTSCEKYDDSELRGRVEANENQLKDLEARVAQLEADYKDQVAALQALTALQEATDLLAKTNAGNIEANAAKIAELLEAINTLSGEADLAIEEIVEILTGLAEKDTLLDEAIEALGVGIINYSYDEATGKVTIMLSNGESFSFLTGDNAVDAVKAVKADDGKYYWAVAGEFLKDANGNKIPVTVTPQVKVDPETREVSVSPDGGVTWYKTGIVDEQVLPLFLSLTADEEYVYVTLADGTKLSVALSSNATDMVFELNKMYFGYGVTQTVQIGMENVAKYVIVKPDGWRVSVVEVKDEPAEDEDDDIDVLTRAAVLDGKTVLKITAPAEGAGEKSGSVSFFCVGEDGRAAIYEVEVAVVEVTMAVHDYGLSGTYDVKVDDENVTYITGATVLSSTVTLKSVYDAAVKDLSKYEVMTGSKTGLPLGEALDLEALELGKEYTVWTIVLGDKDNQKVAPYESMASQSYKKIADLVFSEIKHTDAKVEYKTTAGAGDYYYFIQDMGDNIANWTEDKIATEIASKINSATSASSLMSESAFVDAGNSLLKWYQNDMGSTRFWLVPNHTIFVAIMPKDYQDADHMIYRLVTMEPYKIDEQSTASVTITPVESTTTSVKATMTPAEGTSYYYTGTLLTAEEYMDLEGDDEALMNKAVGNPSTNRVPNTSSTNDKNFSSLAPGKAYYLVVYAFDDTTGKGKVIVQKLETLALAYNEELTTNLDITYTGVNYVEATITVTGGTAKSIRYGYMTKADVEANASLKADIKSAEGLLAVNKTISKRGNFNTANLAADNKYTIENLYPMEEQYLFVIAFDENDVPTHMDYELIDTKAAFDRFSTALVKPVIKEVYYCATTSTSGTKAAYAHELSEWSKMSDVTDVTTLDGVTGSYWLDLDWTATGKTVKRMWLSSENYNNWKNQYALTGTDMKADAMSVIKNRAGYQGSGTAPDFYGRNTTTGAYTIDPATVKVNNTSIPKTLRDKTVNPIAPKTIHFVWETTDGDYGYMTVVPEEYAAKTPGGDEGAGEGEGEGDTPAAGELANSPWGRCWVWQEAGMEASYAYYMLDLGKTKANTVTISVGQPDEEMESMLFTKQANYECSATPTVKTVNGETCLCWENASGDEYRVYFSDLEWYDPSDKVEADATIWSITNSAYETIGIEAKKAMKTYEAAGLPSFTYVDGGVAQ